MSKRVDQWPGALTDYLVGAQKLEFKFGEHDCCTFVSGAIDAIMISPLNLMDGFKGKYSSLEEGEKEIGSTIYDFLLKEFGKPLAPLQGRKGDVAMVEGCCGVVIGAQALFLHDEGYSLVRLRNVTHVFRVPD